MRQERCTLMFTSKEYSKTPTCYYCGSNIESGEDIINRGNRLYHRNCFKRLFTLTAKCLTCGKARECLNQYNES